MNLMFPTVELITHVPVLAEEIAALAEGRLRIVDGTAGAGGHVEAFLRLGATVVAVDRDPDAVAGLRERFGAERLSVHCGGFADAETVSIVRDFAPQFVLLDLGVSTPQLDRDERGFSFRQGVPLDMRMSRAGPTAADLLNAADAGELRRIFRDYGDERHARRLADEIVRRRAREPLATSDDLVNAIRAVLGRGSGPSDFARLFQAVRIAVNRELDQLERGLPDLLEAAEPGGDLAVISYHSGEDRVVKHTFRAWGRSCVCPPRQPVCTCRGRALGRVLTRRPVLPGAAEVESNPRARSAKLRVFRKADDA